VKIITHVETLRHTSISQVDEVFLFLVLKRTHLQLEMPLM